MSVNIFQSIRDHSGENFFSAFFSKLDKVALISFTDEKGNITYVNDYFLEISKYSRDELIGKNHNILSSGDQPQDVFRNLWQTISSGNVWRGDIKDRAKDGSFFWTDTVISPVTGDRGEILSYFSFRLPIDERKQVELYQHDKINALSNLQIAVEYASNHIIVTDNKGYITYANKAAQQITGYSLKEMHGQTPRLWGKQMSREFYEKMWKQIKEERVPFVGEITNRRKNGEIYTAITRISPIVSEGNLIGFIGSEEDISKRLDLELQLTNKVRELERINRLMIGREIRMKELKQEIKLLRDKYEKNI